MSQVISFALYNLCKHPEYIDPLMKEVLAMEKLPDGQRNYDDLPLMDSFLKETARLNPTIIRRLESRSDQVVLTSHCSDNAS